MVRQNALAYVLGGGKGERLWPLTQDRAKPAVPFGGQYRVIDFVLSNLYHSHVRKIYVFTQYESYSLHEHIENGWHPRFGIGVEESLKLLPAKQGEFAGWSTGTADAIYKNLRFINSNPDVDVINIFGADHIYLMDISQMNEFHIDNDAELTISAIPVKIKDAAKAFGVLTVDKDWKLLNFEEKPENPAPIPGNDEYCLASMGNYAFKPSVLGVTLSDNAKKEMSLDKELVKSNPERFSSYDFGLDILPAMLRQGKRIFVYNFTDNKVRGATASEVGFWRDIGNLDQFYLANMEMRSTVPPINLYNPSWTILTYVRSVEPAKFVGETKSLDSIVSNGVIASNSHIERSIVSYGTRIGDGTRVLDSIVLGYNNIGRGVTIRKAIIERGVNIPDGVNIGEDRELDNQRHFTFSKNGVVVVPKGTKFQQ